MKILIHGLNFSPELIGIGKYTGELAAWLAQAGHDVHVVTAPPYYPEWKVQQPYSGWKYQKENWQRVQVIRCPLWVPCNPTGVTRIIHLFSFAVSSFFAMINQIKFKPDVVISIVPTLFAASTSAWVARRSKAISWLHIQDFELDAAANLGMVHSKNVMMRLAIQWEKSVLLRFDRVSSISTQMVNRLISKGVPKEKTALFPNWVDTHSIYPLPTRDNPYRSKLGISDDHIVVLYSGNMGAKQGLGIIVDAAKQLKEHRKIVFVLCGNGAFRSELEKSANGLQNLQFLDLQPLEQLNFLLNAADIHILPQQSGAADLVMPSKLLGMLASGRPVIATAHDGTELANVVSQVGIVTTPGNVDALVQAILQLEGSPELRDKLGKRSVELVNNKWGQEIVIGDFQRRLMNL
ncbi:MAG: colanic acid biosynthesis glycosyltransferase WcaI [Chloroflexi bacterium HGW-Chloroflexi-5]|jgi:colanic acid biosynthesis glycosyl transferase WcaI|nr:MAG: colanic acid biosynthesis glycosyltransferase WcaI [Chloroflexi bacterium HGW-Chloroflexi-5]